MITRLTLTLYTRTNCHLCEEMKQQLELFQQQYDFSINIVDIETDNYLKLRYGEKIPVLARGEQEICHYHLNEDIIQKYFRGLQ